MLRKLLMGGVAASLLAMNTGCSCVQSLLCHCWNELSPCHWGCDRAFGCNDSCEPCNEYGQWTGGCDSCGGGGCNSCASTGGGGGGYGPYMAQGEGAPQYAMQEQGPPPAMARQGYGQRMASSSGKYGHGDGQIIPGSEVWTEGPAPAGAGSAMMVEAPAAAAPAAAPPARYRTAQRTQPARRQMQQPMRQPAVVAQQNVEWAGEARPLPPNRPTRKVSYSKYR